MTDSTRREWKKELKMYDNAMKARDTLLNVLHSLLHNRTDSARGEFLDKVSAVVDLFSLKDTLAVRRSRST